MNIARIIATKIDLFAAPREVQQQFAFMLLQDSTALQRFGVTEQEARELSEGFVPPPAPILPEPEEITLPIVPNWDGFIQAMLMDADYNQAMGVALQTAPGLASSFATVFAQAAINLPLFLGVLQIFKSITTPTSTALERWVELAQRFDLPDELVEAIAAE